MIPYDQYRNAYVNAITLNHKKPIDISLELSSVCNMYCGYCYHADKKNIPFKQQFMQPTTFKKIVAQAAELGVMSIKFNWRGESTMNPFFSLMTKLAKGLAKDLTFIDRITNSNFKFDTQRNDIFEGLCNQTKVKVSYDSFDKKVFEAQRNGGDHDTTTRNIHKFYHWPGRETEIILQAVRTKANADEDFASEIAKRWPKIKLSVRDMVEGRVNKDLSQLKYRDRDYSKRQSCIQAHARLIFAWDGTATVCCPDIKQELAIGNINDMTLEQIWNHDKAKKLRDDLISLKAFKNSPCRNCSSFETFAGYKPVWES